MKIINYSRTVARETIKRGTGRFVDVSTTVIPFAGRVMPDLYGRVKTPIDIRLVKIHYDNATKNRTYRYYWHNQFGCKSKDLEISREQVEAFGFDWCEVGQWYIVDEALHCEIKKELSK